MTQLGKRITREELYEAVWSKTIKSLVLEWNTNYLQVDEACRKLQVPRPKQGYWQWIARGRPVKRKPLRKPTKRLPAAWVLLRRVEPAASRAAAPPAVTAAEGQRTQGERKDAVSQAGKAPTAAPLGEPEERPADRATADVMDTEAELPQVAEGAVLDMLRQATEVDFWEERISRRFGPGQLAPWLGLGDGAMTSEGVLRDAVKGVRKEYRSFIVGVEETKDEYGRSRVVVEITLREGSEWRDAWEEAWTLAKNPNPHCLSDNALRLYLWAKGPKNTGELRERKIIGAQAKLRRTYNDMEERLREIRLKADANIQWEAVGGLWHTKFRIWFEKREERFYDHGPLNPALGLNLRRGGASELGRFRKWLYEEIMKPGFPGGAERVGIFDIRDRKTLKAVFNGLPGDCGNYGPLPDFFEAVRVVDGIEIRHRFDAGAGPWLVICQVRTGTTWKEIKARLAAKTEEIPLEKRYSLSADALALLKWIVDLRRDEYLLGMTPEVEERLRDDIGIATELGGGNERAYLELLVEEINEKTDFRLRTIPWRHCAHEDTRILVKKQEPGLEGVVRAVQALGLSKGKLLDGDRVRETIGGLVGRC